MAPILNSKHVILVSGDIDLLRVTWSNSRLLLILKPIRKWEYNVINVLNMCFQCSSDLDIWLGDLYYKTKIIHPKVISVSNESYLRGQFNGFQTRLF